MKYLLFIILLGAVLITAGCTSGNQNTVVTPTQTSQVQTIVVTPTSTTVSSSPILTPSPTQSMASQNLPTNSYEKCEYAASNVNSCSGGYYTDKAYCNYWQMRFNASCSATPSLTSESISDFKTFSNEEFSIKYPSTWSIDDPANLSVDKRMLFLGDNIKNGPHSISVMHSFAKTFVELNPEIPPTIDEWITRWTSRAPKTWYYAEQKKISIDGSAAYQLISVQNDPGKYLGLCQETIFINKDTDTEYTIWFCNDPDNYFSNENLYTKVIDSFKFNTSFLPTPTAKLPTPIPKIVLENTDDKKFVDAAEACFRETPTITNMTTRMMFTTCMQHTPTPTSVCARSYRNNVLKYTNDDDTTAGYKRIRDNVNYSRDWFYKNIKEGAC